MKYTIVFFTHSGAIKFEKKMQKLNIHCTLQPVPRKLSSSCGVCARIEYGGKIENLIEPEVESIYRDVSKAEFDLLFDGHSA